MSRIGWALAVALLALSCAPDHAAAQADPDLGPLPPPHRAPPRLVWNEDWPRFRPIGYLATSASVLAALWVTFYIDYPDEPRWSHGVLFDNGVRNALRVRDPGMRDGIRIASDITLATSLVHVALIDSVLIPFAAGSADIAAQLTLMNAQAMSLNILIATLLFKAVARARPLIADCQRDTDFDPLCNTGSYASFPSSHTSTAFTAAGLTCVHHEYLPIYGGDPWDTGACIGALALATATGLFRVLGDRHYATDVLVGAAIGLSLGYIYPWLLHYREGDPMHSVQNSPTWAVMPSAPSAPYGMSFAGTF